jgi:hypothetical protein
MSYCELSDAYENHSNKFRESFSVPDDKDLGSEKLSVNSNNNKSSQRIKNYSGDISKNNNNTLWANVNEDDSDLESNLSFGMSSRPNNDNSMWSDTQSKSAKTSKLEVEGTDLTSLIDLDNKTQKTNKPNKLNKPKKLTHRECIKLYFNPNLKSQNSYESALAHVLACSICKNEINSNKKVSFDDKKSNQDANTLDNNSIDSILQKQNRRSILKNLSNQNSHENFSMSENDSFLKSFENLHSKNSNSNNTLTNTTNTPTNPTNTPTNPTNQNKLLDDEKKLHEQNLLIQKTVQKFLEDEKDKKEMNDKIDKIYKMLDLEIKKNEMRERNMHKRLSMRNVQSYKEDSTNSKTSSNNFTIELNFLSVGICLIIIFLIVDIIIRIKY